MSTRRLFETAFTLHRNGDLPAAETFYRQLLADEPRHAPALHLLGLLCQQTGRHQQAVTLIQQALAITPDEPDYLNNLGAALRASGQPDQAVACYRRALAIAPQDLDLQHNLGNAYLELQAFTDAAHCYRTVLAAWPGNETARAALVHALQAQGFACHNGGRHAEAEAAYQEAAALHPHDGALHYNLGNAQRELGKTEAALKSYRQALKLLPDDADVYNNLGNVLRETGQLREAIIAYQTAIHHNPRLYHAKVHLIHQRQHACEWERLEHDVAEVREWVRTVPAARISPFAFLAMPGTTPEEQRRCADNWAEQQCAALLAQQAPYVHERGRRPHRLRIGYLSSDFRLHPLAFLISELIELHDRGQFEIHAYSAAADDGSAERKRLERAFDHFTDIRALTPQQAAARIHQDEIDILVDLTGFTQTSRSALVALRPAPISINWLGFPGTMGALNGRPLFDYILTDDYVTPARHADHFAEALLPLTPCYQPNDRQRPVGAAGTRADHALPLDAMVFCCFNQTFKILPQVFDIWMDLLNERADSVLWLLESNAPARENLLRAAMTRGVAAERLVFAPRLPIAAHLARHEHADLFLDTLPYNAHTTASDALWMGLPLLTCSGEGFAGRVAGSLLHALGMDELIAADLDDYARKAMRLSADRAQLSALRQRLLDARDDGPLFDTERFARTLEARYQAVWRHHAGGA